MALKVSGMKRVFLMTSLGKKITLDDLNPQAKPETIKALYADQYPELATATVNGPVMRTERIEYEFTEKVGTKG